MARQVPQWWLGVQYWYGTVEMRIDDVKGGVDAAEQALGLAEQRIAALEGDLKEERLARQALEGYLKEAVARITCLELQGGKMQLAGVATSPVSQQQSNASGQGGSSSSAAAVAVSQPPPQPPSCPSSPAPAPAGSPAQQHQHLRTLPCSSCRGAELACPVCDKGMVFEADSAEVRWYFAETNRTLNSYFTYGDVAVSGAKFPQSSLEGSLFLGADGEFQRKTFRALIQGLNAEQFEMVFHRTNSGAHCILAVRCLACNYCCSLAFSKWNTMAYGDLRVSLSRWLGTGAQEVPGSACYVVGQQALFSDARQRQLRTAVGAPVNCLDQ